MATRTRHLSDMLRRITLATSPADLFEIAKEIDRTDSAELRAEMQQIEAAIKARMAQVVSTGLDGLYRGAKSRILRFLGGPGS